MKIAGVENRLAIGCHCNGRGSKCGCKPSTPNDNPDCMSQAKLLGVGSSLMTGAESIGQTKCHASTSKQLHLAEVEWDIEACCSLLKLWINC